jgi:transposase
MGKPYSMDLRERVIAAVKTGGMSCNRAARQFGIGVSTAIRRLGVLLRKQIFDVYAAMPSSWNTPRMAVRMTA